ncbi:MAG: hypothetical protein ACRDVC_09330 [Acidimicrobiales bacterium]
MSVTRATLLLAVLLYATLWVLAINGATDLVVPLAIPAILAVMIILGVMLQRYMGIAPRRPHFRDPKDDPKS